jgi:hypothetical protein
LPPSCLYASVEGSATYRVHSTQGQEHFARTESSTAQACCPNRSGLPPPNRNIFLSNSPTRYASSVGRIHFLSGLHLRHPMHGFMESLLTSTHSTSAPTAGASSATILSSVDVTPFFLGLALRKRIILATFSFNYVARPRQTTTSYQK